MSHIGTNNIGKMYFGGIAIGKAYLGSDLVYSSVGGDTPVLPYDAEIEYLQSTGTQYIDTGISMSTSLKTEMKAQYTSTSGSTSMALIGAFDTGTTFAVPVGLQGNGGKLYVQIGSGYALSNATQSALHTFTSWVSENAMYLDVDGITVSKSGISSFSTRPLYLFARNNAGTAGNIASAKMYYCKLWSGTTLVFDAIPVRVGTTGYMYDRVGGQLFGNSGSGNFTLGNDK